MMYIETRRGVLAYRHLNSEIDTIPLLFIHGAGSGHRNWKRVVSHLEDYNSLLIDLSGHTLLPSTGHRSIADYAEDVFTLLDTLAIKQVIVVGHSMGGAIAQWLALHLPERVERLVLVATNADLDVNPALIEGLKNDYEGMCATIARWSCNDDNVRDYVQEAYAKIPPSVMIGDYVACDQFHLLDQVHQIQIQTLILNGTADRMTPIESARHLRDALPNAQLIEFEGGSHQIPLEMPMQVADEIRNWLSQLPQ